MCVAVGTRPDTSNTYDSRGTGGHVVAGARVAGILADLVAGGPPPTWPRRLVDSCQEATAMTGVGLALADAAGIAGIVAATGGAAQQLEELQFTLGEGPCVEASRTGRPVLCSDLLEHGLDRWPAFTPEAGGLGVAAAFTFPVQAGAISIGVLDLYRASRGPLDEGHMDAAVAYSDAAVAVLLHLHGQGGSVAGRHGARREGIGDPDSGPDLAGLVDLVDRRACVHQAAGMISVQLGVDIDGALLRLRAHAWAQQRPIAEVAAEVVARRVRFDESRTGTAEDGGEEGVHRRSGGEPS
jgi:hypothetical protein